jgi:hypothetical protein
MRWTGVCGTAIPRACQRHRRAWGRQPRRRDRRLPVPLRFLTRYFETRTLTSFAIYCLIAGTASLARTALA